MGSFRLAAGTLHRHSEFNFAESRVVPVWGAVAYNLNLRGFSRKHGINHFVPQRGPRHHVSGLYPRIFQRILPTRLNRDNQHPAELAFSVAPSQSYEVQEY